MTYLLSKEPYPLCVGKTLFEGGNFVVERSGNTLINKSTGKVLSRQADGTWIERAVGDTSDNGIDMRLNGQLAVYNPEPGGVVPFVCLEIGNA